jgi:hypothetical protein
MSNILRHDAGNIKTIAASDSHTNISLYVGTCSRYIDTYTHFTWAGGTFSPVVLLCQFFAGGK